MFSGATRVRLNVEPQTSQRETTSDKWRNNRMIKWNSLSCQANQWTLPLSIRYLLPAWALSLPLSLTLSHSFHHCNTCSFHRSLLSVARSSCLVLPLSCCLSSNLFSLLFTVFSLLSFPVLCIHSASPPFHLIPHLSKNRAAWFLLFLIFILLPSRVWQTNISSQY